MEDETFQSEEQPDQTNSELDKRAKLIEQLNQYAGPTHTMSRNNLLQNSDTIGSERQQILLEAMQSGDDLLLLPSVIELNDFLSLSTEESLGGFPVHFSL